MNFAIFVVGALTVTEILDIYKATILFALAVRFHNMSAGQRYGG
jgi:hypothetical protein